MSGILSTPIFAIESLDYALDCDDKDPLKEFQNEFLFPPTHASHVSIDSSATTQTSVQRSKCIYLCGNSLGLQPKGMRICI